jgi:hypothetical protein
MSAALIVLVVGAVGVAVLLFLVNLVGRAPMNEG